MCCAASKLPPLAASTTVGNYQYTLYSTSATFTAAEAACAAAGGHLASFATSAEASTVLTAFNAFFVSGPVVVGSVSPQLVWIGLNKLRSGSGDWSWTDLSPVSYVDFGKRYEASAVSYYAARQCAAVWWERSKVRRAAQLSAPPASSSPAASLHLVADRETVWLRCAQAWAPRACTETNPYICKKVASGASFAPPPPLPLYNNGGNFTLPITYEGSRYLYVSDPRSYAAAKRFCAAALPNGRLAYGTASNSSTPTWSHYYWVMQQVRRPGGQQAPFSRALALWRGRVAHLAPERIVHMHNRVAGGRVPGQRAVQRPVPATAAAGAAGAAHQHGLPHHCGARRRQQHLGGRLCQQHRLVGQLLQRR